MNNYLRVTNGIWKKKKIFGRTDEINIFVDFYKEKAEEIEKNHVRSLDIIENLFECLKRINNNS